ncbi:MAG: cytochrome P450 [Pseudomonadota bacterium]
MAIIPRDTMPDSTLAFALEGYTFIRRRCQRYRADIFQTRLLFQRTICMLGAEAAELFYDTDRFERSGAAPRRVQETLFGRGGVQGMDGTAHRHRKAMFMELMSPASIQRLAELSVEQWRVHTEKWRRMDTVVLLSETQEILCRTVCAWAGVPLAEAEVEQRTKDFVAMIEGGGAIGPRHWRGRRARNRAEHWLGDFIEKVRRQEMPAEADNALAVIALHRDMNGELLDKQVAAVELINVLRPTVAVAWYTTFAALALHQHPECRRELDTDGYLELFVQEVRRFYPFFPVVAARVRHDFEWRGYPFPKGVRVLLDLYGTNHDPRQWDHPEQFRPERFRHWDGGAFNFIPQGGGDHYRQHRCPGEWITIALMKAAIMLLIRLDYDVPTQDLRVSLMRMPTAPKSGFVIQHVGETRGGVQVPKPR